MGKFKRPILKNITVIVCVILSCINANVRTNPFPCLKPFCLLSLHLRDKIFGTDILNIIAARGVDIVIQPILSRLEDFNFAKSCQDRAALYSKAGNLRSTIAMAA